MKRIAAIIFLALALASSLSAWKWESVHRSANIVWGDHHTDRSAMTCGLPCWWSHN